MSEIPHSHSSNIDFEPGGIMDFDFSMYDSIKLDLETVAKEKGITTLEEFSSRMEELGLRVVPTADPSLKRFFRWLGIVRTDP